MKSALEGLKVVDFSWAIVGPLTAEYLAQMGATVVKVESQVRPDPLRTYPPFKDREVDTSKSGHFTSYNANKYGVTINISHPKGRELARELTKWADVVIEGFTPGTVKKLQLDYESIVKLNPGVIYLSTSNLGQTGPQSKQAGFGVQLTSFAGFASLLGWTDRDPCAAYGAYTDFCCPGFAVSVIVAALEYRRRKGRGIYIDLSQLEASLYFLAPLLLDYFVNGRVAQRMGNRSPWACPQGAFRCKGDDQWCVISVETEEEWSGLCKAMGNPSWTKEFCSFLERRKREDELERLIEEWTANFEAEELFHLLQREGVPAGIVLSNKQVHENPQLIYRKHFVHLPHKAIGFHAYDSIPFRLSKTPPELKSAAPILGEHNDYVFTRILGLSDEEFAKLIAEEVIY